MNEISSTYNIFTHKQKNKEEKKEEKSEMENEILQWFVGKKMTYKARYIKKNTVWIFTVGIDVALIF